MIDEAFLTLSELLERMLSFPGEINDEEAGIHSYVYECSIDTPIELSVVREADGHLQIGSVPPLYDERTSFLPSFHQVRFTAVRIDENGNEIVAGDDSETLDPGTVEDEDGG